MSLKAILGRGYFPKELPRPFITTKFADLLSASDIRIEGAFAENVTKKAKIPKAKLCHYAQARGGLLRRRLSISNPVLFYLLAREIDMNWASITTATGGSRLAATAPERKINGRSINGKCSLSDREKLALQTRIGKRFVLVTDISRFYHSIYTNSISWALHKKAEVEANDTFKFLGNKLNFLVRQGQGGQTVGIPIGPDTSLVLAELIMHQCDKALVDKLPNVKGYRFVDDYELSFRSQAEAERAFHMLEACLSEYELALNFKKTNILKLPLPLKSEWSRKLTQYHFRTSSQKQATDLESFFSLAFGLSQTYVGETVLPFAIGRLRSVDIDPSNWDLFQRLLLLCVVPEPAVLPHALEHIIKGVNAGLLPLRQEIQDTFNDIIVSHAPLKHSSEVANSLWGCLVLNLELQDQAVDLISACEDSCVALLALDCQARGLLSKHLDTSLWETQMCAEGLYKEHWLLSYEANVKGWLPSVGKIDHVNADINFGYLKKNGVHFYEENFTSPDAKGALPMPSLPSLSGDSTISLF